MCPNLLSIVLPNIEASEETLRYKVENTLLLAIGRRKTLNTRRTL
jgi:hypothetical protein